MARTVWIVRWRGFEEQCAGRQDAMDRWSQLDARGIEAELVEVTAEGDE
jgi:Iap family predicted aminopeptidase